MGYSHFILCYVTINKNQLEITEPRNHGDFATEFTGVGFHSMCYQICKHKPQLQLLNHNRQEFKIIFPIHYVCDPTPLTWKLMSNLKAQQWGWVFTWSKCSQTARRVPPGGDKLFQSGLHQTQPVEYFSE